MGQFCRVQVESTHVYSRLELIGFYESRCFAHNFTVMGAALSGEQRISPTACARIRCTSDHAGPDGSDSCAYRRGPRMASTRRGSHSPQFAIYRKNTRSAGAMPEVETRDQRRAPSVTKYASTSIGSSAQNGRPLRSYHSRKSRIFDLH